MSGKPEPKPHFAVCVHNEGFVLIEVPAEVEASLLHVE